MVWVAAVWGRLRVRDERQRKGSVGCGGGKLGKKKSWPAAQGVKNIKPGVVVYERL